MRLLNTKSFDLQDFVGLSTPPYAILSHTWGAQEIIFTDIGNLEEARWKKGFWKFERSCAQALHDGWECKYEEHTTVLYLIAMVL
jgi:hypothetical protein